MAADLVGRQVAVIAANGPAVVAAKAATTDIPIVFSVGLDPVASGLVASLNKPGGNLTGDTILFDEVGPKRLGSDGDPCCGAHQPGLSHCGDPIERHAGGRRHPGVGDPCPACQHGTRLRNGLCNLGPTERSALVVGNDSFFNSRSEQLAALMVRHAVPTIFQTREFAAAGGLVSYGGSITTSYRQVGI